MQPSSHSCTKLSKMKFFPVSIVDKYLPISHANFDLKEIFPRISIAAVYGSEKSLKEIFLS